MSPPLEDYALLGDMHSAALVQRNGSIDWLCLPRLDGAAVFAALLGDDDNGSWRLAPVGAGAATRRRYLPDTLILESEWDVPAGEGTAGGTVRITDFMPPRDEVPNLIRIVDGVSGAVDLTSEIRFRFDYGRSVPWVRHAANEVSALAGPDAVSLTALGRDLQFHGRNLASYADFTVSAGERVAFVLTWHPSHEPAPPHEIPGEAFDATREFWEQWAAHCTYEGPHREAVVRSLITLKALIYQPTGGIVAAPTTSLPEDLGTVVGTDDDGQDVYSGGVRNWDYRFCWLRDATLTLEALLLSGYTTEADAWRQWLLRAIAGSPDQLQILYGLAGERRLPEVELPWLAGYENSRPVRCGNAAADQLQLDVYGEVMNALALARESELDGATESWELQVALLGWLEAHWGEPDEGLWEVRGGRQHFVHSKVLAWVAFDRGIAAVEKDGRTGPVERWREVRQQIFNDVLTHGYDAKRATFTQYYGGQTLDAATLLIPAMGFLPPDDPRVIGTVAAIRDELLHDGLLMRYGGGGMTQGEVDGLAGTEGAFLACSFWLVDALSATGQEAEAEALFGRLLGLRNDLGLLAEEYDPRYSRQVGNFPQAFTHLALVHSAFRLRSGSNTDGGSGRYRAEGREEDSS